MRVLAKSARDTPYSVLRDPPDTLFRLYRVSNSFHLASEFDPEDPLDDEWRFTMFDSVAVGTVRHSVVARSACE